MTGYEIFTNIMAILISAEILYVAIRMNKKRSFKED